MPLLCFSVGNDGNSEEAHSVGYPARYAFEGTIEGFENGYDCILAVGGTNYLQARMGMSSWTTGENHVSVVATGETIFQAWPPTAGDQPNYFINGSGTSSACPLVTGVVSLVFSQSIDNGAALSSYEVQRIVEKTSRDVNFATAPYFDNLLGFGLIDCEAAVTNLDLYSWELEDDEWYYISTNVDRVYSSVKRIMEEITLDNNIYVDGLAILKGWDVENEEEQVWDPPVGDDFNWDVHEMIKIKLNDEADKYTNELLICGQAVDIDSDITLVDDGELDGWNWVAYYPDYETSAPLALTSIATSGDPDSDLLIAKGWDGSFYQVDVGFSNLTMKPGEGYMMQLDEDRNATLNYPDEEPELLPDPHDDDKQIAKIQHFQFQSCTEDFLPVLITEISLREGQPEAGDEIGVFISDTLCVGAGVWQEGIIGFAAWSDDESTPNIDGFRDFNDLTFRYWDSSENEEIGQGNIGISTDSNEPEPSFLLTSLQFDGPVKKAEIPQDYSFGPVYPNPFNSSTTINFALPSTESVNLSLFEVDGRLVKEVIVGYITAGSHRFILDGSELSSGTYLIRLVVSNHTFSERIVLLK